VDLVETQVLLVRVELCDKDQDLLALLTRKLCIQCTKCHFEIHFLFHINLKDILCALA
jgi:hypothetical protein